MCSGRILNFLLIFLLVRGLSAQTCWRLTSCNGPVDAAFPGIWESNIYAPSSRTVSPKSILSTRTGNVIAKYPYMPTLAGNGSILVFDFGVEVGGLATINFTSTGAGAIGVAFTEAKNWIGEWSDSSNGRFKGPDGALYGNFTSAGKHAYVMPDARLRGGFRYMTIFLVTNVATNVNITEINLEIGFQPTWSNLQAYQGYFHSNDELLNRIWYSGAYTLQTNTVPVNTGRQVPFVVNGWANNGTLGHGDTIIVDGAKRDRAVWPGDMGVAVPSAFVSLGDLDSVKNALQTMYDHQNSVDGSFPEAGPPLLQLGSDTYHMWSMIGTYSYILYTNDTAFLQQNWGKYKHAMSFIYNKVQPSGLLNVTGTRDWARWQQGWNNSEANMILYRTLLTGADLANWAGDATNLSSTWRSQAAALRSAINTHCWDSSYGAFKDNATDTNLHPQDANSMSILFNVVNSSTRAEGVSTSLLKNWTPIGAVAPELPGNISPFISSLEIQAHLSLRQTQRALDLIRRSWGWYINHPNGTGSTVIEGYLANGSFAYRSSRGYNYDASYVSHAHGWSSGPTAALTSYVLGLTVTSPAGASWRLAPQFGDLSHVEAGFVTSRGKYQAAWTLAPTGNYTLTFQAPRGTLGSLELPCLQAGMRPATLSMDGRRVSARDAVVDGGVVKMSVEGTGGSHTIVVA